MNALTAPQATQTGRDGDDLNHLHCCDENRALCGSGVDTHDELPEPNCVVCLDLDEAEAPCGISGCPFEGAA